MSTNETCYKTEPGMAGGFPQAPSGDPDTQTSKFYKDN